MGEKDVSIEHEGDLWTKLARVYVEHCSLIGDNARQDVYLVLQGEKMDLGQPDDSVWEDHS